MSSFEIDITHDSKNNLIQIDSIQKNMDNKLTANIDLPTALKLRKQLDNVIDKLQNKKKTLKLYNI